MPLYRTTPDVSLDDLVTHLEWVGEPIIMMHQGDGGWIVLTSPPLGKQACGTTTLGARGAI